MASFEDKEKRTWVISLDAIILDKIKSEHGVDLVDLNNDPLEKLRSNPVILWLVILELCRSQLNDSGLSAEQFAKSLPVPPDPQFEAIKQAIIDFFPTGQASHVREVLTGFERMANSMSQILMRKMEQKHAGIVSKIEAVSDEVIDGQVDGLIEKTLQTHSKLGASN